MPIVLNIPVHIFVNISLLLTIVSNVLPTVDASWFQEQQNAPGLQAVIAMVQEVQ